MRHTLLSRELTGVSEDVNLCSISDNGDVGTFMDHLQLGLGLGSGLGLGTLIVYLCFTEWYHKVTGWNLILGGAVESFWLKKEARVWVADT